MEERINIDELISKYTSFNSKDAKRNYLAKTVKTVDYLPFASVCVNANSIVDNTSFDENGNIHIDSCKRYIMYTFAILKLYTNLDVHEDSFTDEFDKLCKAKMLNEIIALIDEDQVKTFETVLKMKTDDAITNNYGIQNYINKNIVPVISKYFDMFVNNMAEMMQNVDIDKLAERLEEITSN